MILPRSAFLARVAGAAGAGLLLNLAFPRYDLPVVGLLAVPALVALTAGQAAPRGAAVAVAAGLAFFGFHLSWIETFGWYAWAGLVVVQAGYFAAFGALLPRVLRSGPLVAALSAGGLWAGLEMLRGAVPLGGFPWSPLGAALHSLAGGRGLAALVGTNGLSALIVAASVLLLAGLHPPLLRWEQARGYLDPRRRTLPDRALASMLLVSLVLVVALQPYRGEKASSRELRVAIVQAGMEAPWYSRPDYAQILDRHIRLTRELAGEELDLVMWGEGAVEGGASVQVVGDVARAIGISLASGAVEEAASGGWFNLVVAADPKGEQIGRYAKQQPVPFGEYVPLRPVFGRLPVLAREVPRGMRRGDGPVLLRYRFGAAAPVVSYESAFPDIVRRSANLGADLIQVHTNNSSFGRSAASEQHLALDQMRAAELGRPVARAAITGISALIDADGAVVARLGLYEQGTLTGSLALRNATTPYARLGDWTLAIPLALLAVWSLAHSAFGRRPRNGRGEGPRESIVT